MKINEELIKDTITSQYDISLPILKSELFFVQHSVCIKYWCSQYYSMDAKLGRLLKRWRTKLKPSKIKHTDDY